MFLKPGVLRLGARGNGAAFREQSLPVWLAGEDGGWSGNFQCSGQACRVG